MKIIREGILTARAVPQRPPTEMGFQCEGCGCVFEAEAAETRPICLYGKYGRIAEVVYTCACPTCGKQVSAESYRYE